MFERINWQPDRKELQRFAAAMLIGFSLLALLSAWRAKGIGQSSIVLTAIGVSLAIAAFIPKLGRVAYLAVYLPTSVVGHIVSSIVLTLIFFLVFTPLGLVMRFMGKDFLQQRRPKQQAGWKRVATVKTEESYYRQF